MNVRNLPGVAAACDAAYVTLRDTLSARSLNALAYGDEPAPWFEAFADHNPTKLSRSDVAMVNNLSMLVLTELTKVAERGEKLDIAVWTSARRAGIAPERGEADAIDLAHRLGELRPCVRRSRSGSGRAFLRAMREIREELEADGITIDAAAWLRDLDDEVPRIVTDEGEETSCNSAR